MSATRPHRKLVKHYHEPGDLHELTFSCYRRQPLLTNDAWREHLADCVDAACDEHEMQLAAFVFMPEHVHLLVVPNGNEPAVERLLARIKQPFSKWVKLQLIDGKSPLLDRLTVQERPGMHCFRFWQEGPGFGTLGLRGYCKSTVCKPLIGSSTGAAAGQLSIYLLARSRCAAYLQCCW